MTSTLEGMSPTLSAFEKLKKSLEDVQLSLNSQVILPS